MDFVKHLKTYLSDKEIDSLISSLNNPSIGGLILNTKKMSKDKLLSLFPSLVEHPFIQNAFIYDKDKVKPSSSLYYELGCYYLQDPSAMMVSYFLDIEDNDILLDLCGAPGGKSIDLSLKSNSSNIIISNDISLDRLNSLEFNAASLGLNNLVITHNDFSKDNLYLKFLNYFDKIVVDAPCSGSGMFRKEEKMKDDWTYNKVLKYQAIQKELILYSFDMLKEGGTLSYSTCSFSEEEDEDIIEYLLENRKDAELVKLEESPYFYIDRYKPYGIHLFPSLFKGEGQYICLVRKKGHKEYKQVKNKRIEETSRVYKNQFKENPYPYYLEYKGYLYTLSTLIDEYLLNNLNVLYPGVRIGKLSDNKVFKYDVHYARIIDEFPLKVELTEKESFSFIGGASISKNGIKSVSLLTYDNLPLSFSKGNGSILKNWYNIYRY